MEVIVRNVLGIFLFFYLFLVDLCPPLLVGVLSDKEEDDREVRGKRRKTEVFLCIKQSLVLEVDMQHGRERCRLELDSLSRVDTSEAAWTKEVRRGREGYRKRWKERSSGRRSKRKMLNYTKND